MLRGEQALASARALERRIERVGQELATLDGERRADARRRAATTPTRRGLPRSNPSCRESSPSASARPRSRLAELQRERERQLALLERLRRRARARARRRASRATCAPDASASASPRRSAGRSDARREAERVGAELAAVNQFLRAHARFGAEGEAGPKALGEELGVRDGYELALAAALGGRLDAALVDDVPGAQALLDRAGPDGGIALLAGRGGDDASGAPAAAAASAPAAPAPGAQRLLELLSGPARALALAQRLLDDAWVVERLEDLADDFRGIATTREGRVLFAAAGELRQLGEGGSERVLARRNERDRLIAAVEHAAEEERRARAQREAALESLRAAESGVAAAEDAVRDAERSRVEASEAVRRTEWLIEQRRAAPAEGAAAVRKAQLEGELAAERRLTERRALERAGSWRGSASSGRGARRTPSSCPSPGALPQCSPRPQLPRARAWRRSSTSSTPTVRRASRPRPSCAPAPRRRPRSRSGCEAPPRRSRQPRCRRSGTATRSPRPSSSWRL